MYLSRKESTAPQGKPTRPQLSPKTFTPPIQMLRFSFHLCKFLHQNHNFRCPSKFSKFSSSPNKCNKIPLSQKKNRHSRCPAKVLKFSLSHKGFKIRSFPKSLNNYPCPRKVSIFSQYPRSLKFLLCSKNSKNPTLWQKTTMQLCPRGGSVQRWWKMPNTSYPEYLSE